ncbi:12029_t:CDS:2, partial [Funneliformis mosseae]
IPTDIRKNATHIVLFSGGGSTRKLADIIQMLIRTKLQRSSMDTPLNLEREIESLGNTSN